MRSILVTVILLFLVSSTIADVSHLLSEYASTTHAPPANPYVFAYSAGRAPGHVDRTHTEVSDGSGVIRGAFSYVDPRQQLRTVKYTADQYGFHPELSHETQDTEANKLARAKHLELYNKIALQHASGQAVNEPIPDGPQNSPALVIATNKHLSLYAKIAKQHALIGAQQEAERLAFEATSEANQTGKNKNQH